MDADKKRKLLLGGALLALVALCYWQIVQAGFIWDDDSYVTNNPALRDLGGLFDIWFSPTASPQYYPVVFTTFWLEQQLWGLAPLGYHLVNLLLHAATAIGLWLLLERLAIPGAWFAAAIFAVHPINVESVAWITERKNVLSGALGVQAALYYLRFREERRAALAAGRSPVITPYLVAGGLFLLALLSKSIIAMLPLALLIVIWWQEGALTRADLGAIAPFLLAGGVAGLSTAWLEVTHVGASGAEWRLSSVERVLVAGRAAVFYLEKLLWPAELMFSYPRWQIGGAWWQYLYPAGVAGGVASSWLLRRRIGRGPCAALCCYLVMLFPASGLLNVYPMRYSFVADHFLYLAGTSLIVLAVVAGRNGLQHLLRPLPEPWGTRTIQAAGCGVIAVLGLLTALRIPEFRDKETLWTATLAKNPSSWLASDSLGVLRGREGRMEEALAFFRHSVALNPQDEVALNGIGLVMLSYGDPEQAASYFLQAATLVPAAEYYNNLGLAYANLGQKAQAIAAYRQAVSLDVKLAEPRFNLAQELQLAGETAEAVTYYNQALAIDPRNAAAHYNLGQLLAAAGDDAQAAWHFEQALTTNPDWRAARDSLRDARSRLPQAQMPPP